MADTRRPTDQQLMALIDRGEIEECLHRYSRGVDRLDRDIVLSVYHADAIDDHGEFHGSPEAFVEWAFDYHTRHQISHHHAIGNISIELDGDTAHVETYWQFYGHNRVSPDTLSFGRYIDRMERRDGRWGIAERVCVIETVCSVDPVAIPDSHMKVMQPFGAGSRDREDLSYARPLRVART